MRAYPRDRPQSFWSQTRSNQEKKFLLDLTLGSVQQNSRTTRQPNSRTAGQPNSRTDRRGESGHDLAGLRQGPGSGPVSREANSVWLLARAYAFIATGPRLFVAAVHSRTETVHELSRTIYRHLNSETMGPLPHSFSPGTG
jgi:hypothetical protein